MEIAMIRSSNNNARRFSGLAFASLLALATASQAFAASKDSLIMGMVLEPPHLDPTAGAAAAIDEVVYANIFEGLTRIDQNGVVQPAIGAKLDDFG